MFSSVNSNSLLCDFLRGIKLQGQMKIINEVKSLPFWVGRNLYLWKDVALPRWIWDLKYTALTLWVKLLGKLGGIPVSHLGKSRLKTRSKGSNWYPQPIGFNTSATEWPDPPLAPPLSSA